MIKPFKKAINMPIENGKKCNPITFSIKSIMCGNHNGLFYPIYYGLSYKGVSLLDNIEQARYDSVKNTDMITYYYRILV